MTGRPFRVVGIGGAARAQSTSEAAMIWMLDQLILRGVQTARFSGIDLHLSMFDPAGGGHDDPRLRPYLDAVRDCDALIISSPVYHGAPSGLVKNALDHLQPLATDARPYLTGRAVCCVAAGGGVLGTASTVASLRDIVHALRGWPTPMQVVISSSTKPFEDGRCTDPKLEKMMTAALEDLCSFMQGMVGRLPQPLELV